jgi:ubiquinone/menaquinone biosynthesis C-methylase UbiE
MNLTCIEERILSRFCKDKKDSSPPEANSEDALGLMKEVFPNFLKEINGKAICDFGCGFGDQSVALINAGAGQVLGIDINQKRINVALAASSQYKNIEFSTCITDAHRGKFDIVISQNSMEHFPNPIETLKEMRSLLKEDGVLLITFGPPWYAPYGAHMQFFTNIPWVHLIFSEKVIMKVRSRYRSDGAKHFEEVESGLNKMSLMKFNRIINKSGTKIEFKHFKCLKNLIFLDQIPLLQELFINHITVKLAKRL